MIATPRVTFRAILGGPLLHSRNPYTDTAHTHTHSEFILAILGKPTKLSSALISFSSYHHPTNLTLTLTLTRVTLPNPKPNNHGSTMGIGTHKRAAPSSLVLVMGTAHQPDPKTWRREAERDREACVWRVA